MVPPAGIKRGSKLVASCLVGHQRQVKSWRLDRYVMTTHAAEPTPLPSTRLLRWLVEAGPGVPMLIRSILLDEMVSSTMAALPGPLNGVLLNVVALCLNAGRIFAVLLFVECSATIWTGRALPRL